MGDDDDGMRVDLTPLSNEIMNGESPPNYRVYFVALNGSVCWTGVNADGFKEACLKVQDVLGRRGVVGADRFEMGEISTPDIRR